MNLGLKRLLIPTFGQVLGSLAAALAIFIALYRDQIAQRFGGEQLNNVLSGGSYKAALATLTNNGLAHTLVIVLFWSLIGLLAYTVVWSIINVSIEARNEVVLQAEYTNRSAIFQRLKAPITQIVLAVILVLCLVASARLLMPYWLDLFGNALLSAGWLQLLIEFLVGLVGTATNLYLLYVLTQLVFLVD